MVKHITLDYCAVWEPAVSPPLRPGRRACTVYAVSRTGDRRSALITVVKDDIVQGFEADLERLGGHSPEEQARLLEVLRCSSGHTGAEIPVAPEAVEAVDTGDTGDALEPLEPLEAVAAEPTAPRDASETPVPAGSGPFTPSPPGPFTPSTPLPITQTLLFD